jgi:peptidoglycan/LPS O-acetylase OafA/YrhL
MFEGPTAKDRLDHFNGSGPGFDAWRLALSILVVFLHTFIVCYGRGAEISEAVGNIGRPVFMALLPIFFGLSGFLVAASAVRTDSVTKFLFFRATRLVPALAVETTLAALILGPLVTTVALADYFTDKRFFAYFGNIIGRVRYELPGVFEASPEPGVVNLNLWTLHAELECYAIMAAAIVFGVIKRRNLLLGFWLTATVALAAWNAAYSTFEAKSLYPTSVFVYSFCTCVVAYVWRDKIVLRRSFFLAAIAVYCALVYLPQTVFLVIPLLCYIMIYVGLSERFRLPTWISGDYSYGTYLYSFVFQQLVVTALPEWRHWWLVFPLSLALTMVFAVASWHMVEKPALKMKAIFSRRKPVTTGPYTNPSPAHPEPR